MAEPSLRLHIGAAIGVSHNTIASDLQASFDKRPAKIKIDAASTSRAAIQSTLDTMFKDRPFEINIGVSEASIANIVNEINAGLKKTRISLPIEIDLNKKLQNEYARFAKRVAKMDSPDGRILAALENLKSAQQALAGTAYDNASFSQKNVEYLKALQTMTDLVAASDRFKNNLATQSRYLLRDDAITTYATELRSISGDTSQLSTYLDRARTALTNASKAITKEDVNKYWQESTFWIKKYTDSAKELQRQTTNRFENTLSTQARYRTRQDKVNSYLSDIDKLPDAAQDVKNRLTEQLRHVQDSMGQAAAATSKADMAKYWEDATYALSQYRDLLKEVTGKTAGGGGGGESKPFKNTFASSPDYIGLFTDIERQKRNLANVKGNTSAFAGYLTASEKALDIAKTAKSQDELNDARARAAKYLSIYTKALREHNQEQSKHDRDIKKDKDQYDREAREASRRAEQAAQEQADALAKLPRTKRDFETYLTTLDPRAFRDLGDEIGNIRKIFDDIEGGSIPAAEGMKKVDEATENFKSSCKELNYEGGNIFTSLQEKFKTFATYLITSMATMAAYKVFQELISNVKELDAALVNLRMVTGESIEDAGRMLTSYSKLAARLGSTTVDVSNAAVEWLRQGYNEEQTNELLTASTVLSRVGFMDSAEAATALTAALKGYDIDISHVMEIVDKFTQVDQVAATSAGDLATALSKTAANAKIAGLSLDEVIGYLARVNETLQEDPESTGTFMNTMLSRMGMIKSGFLEDPETGESFSDVEKVLSGVGIKLRESNSEFRNFGDVLDEVGGKWKSYSSVQQRAIAVAFAGTRQQTRFLALMEGWQQAQDYVQVSAESAGSALEKMGAYEEGLEFKTNRLTASFEEFSGKIANANFFGVLYDGLYGLLSVLNAHDGLLGKLALMFSALVAIKSLSAALQASKWWTAWQNGISQLTSSLSSWSGILQFIKANWIGIATFAVSAGISIYSAFKQHLDQLKQAALDSANGFKSASTATDECVVRIQALKEELGQSNISTERSIEVRAELLSIQEELIKMYGKEAAAIDLITMSTDSATAALAEMNVAEAKRRIRENKWAFEQATTDMTSDHDSLLDVHGNRDLKKLAQQSFATLTDPQTVGGLLLVTGTYEELYDQYTDFYDRVEEHGKQHGINLSGYLDEISEKIKKLRDNLSSENGQLFQLYGELQALTDYTGVYRSLTKAQDALHNAAASGDLQDSKDAVQAFSEALEKLPDAFPENGLAAEEWFHDFVEALQREAERQKILLQLNPEFWTDDGQLSAAVKAIRNALKDPMSGSLKDDTIRNAIQQRKSGALTRIDNEAAYDAITALSVAAYEAGVDLDSLVDMLISVGAFGSKSVGPINDLANSMAGLRTKIDGLTDSYTGLKNAYNALSAGDAAFLEWANTEDNLSDLIKAFPSLTGYLEEYSAGLIDVTELQEQMNRALNTMELQELEDAYKNVVTAADTYGWSSVQVAAQMDILARICPSVKAALYDNETGMWNVSDAALKGALSIQALQEALTNLGRTNIKSELDSIYSQLETTTNEVVQDALLKKAAKLQSQLGPESDTLQSFYNQFTKDIAKINSGRGGSSKSEKSIFAIQKEELDEYLASKQHQIDLLNRAIEAETKLSNDHLAEAKGRIEVYQSSISTYREMQDAIQGLIDSYKDAGLNDETTKLVRELEDSWWEYENQISAARDATISALKAMVDRTSSAVDDIQNAFSTLRVAAEEYASIKAITVDTLQSIVSLGVEYLSFLKDENGQLVINEDRVRQILDAKTEQLAVETAYNYVKELGLALNANDETALARLLNATKESTSATWDLVYANLALLDLNGEQYEQALSNINALRALADNVDINKSMFPDPRLGNYYDDAASALDTIINMTMDLIRHEKEDMVDAIKDQIDAYQKLIDKKKEALKEDADNDDYNRKVEDQIAAISKLQSRIDTLSLDNSREATAKRAELEEELAEKQQDLADFQADYALDKQLDALDDEADAFEETHKSEIEAIERSVSSQERLWRQAIERINGNWEGLYADLLSYNEEYGNTLQSTLIDAWDKASEAVQRYGSFVAAQEGVASRTGASTVLGDSNDYSASQNFASTGSSLRESVKNLVDQMKANSAQWGSADANRRRDLENANSGIAMQISGLTGLPVTRDENGVWWIDGERLYDKFKYHQGGVAGNSPTLRQNELLALLENGEMVLDEAKQNAAYKIVDFIGAMSSRISGVIKNIDFASMVHVPSGPRFSQAMADPTAVGGSWAPNINVEIHHNGDMSDADARRYGHEVASTALSDLKEAFTKRGISGLNPLKA